MKNDRYHNQFYPLTVKFMEADKLGKYRPRFHVRVNHKQKKLRLMWLPATESSNYEAMAYFKSHDLLE